MLYFGIGSLLLAGVVLVQPALAQDAERPATRAAAANVGHACQAEIPRFCAAGDSGPGSGRNAAICLRPYRTSLSLRCRAAVNELLRGRASG